MKLGSVTSGGAAAERPRGAMARPRLQASVLVLERSMEQRNPLNNEADVLEALKAAA